MKSLRNPNWSLILHHYLPIKSFLSLIHQYLSIIQYLNENDEVKKWSFIIKKNFPSKSVIPLTLQNAALCHKGMNGSQNSFLRFKNAWIKMKQNMTLSAQTKHFRLYVPNLHYVFT